MLKNNMNWRKISLLRAIFYEFLTVGRAKAAMWVNMGTHALGICFGIWHAMIVK
jgi:hypothetical protein